MKYNTYMLSGTQNQAGNTQEKTIGIILRETEKVSKENGLNERQSMHMRLLAEELICMLPQIMQYGSGTFWIEFYTNTVEIHVKVQGKRSIDSGDAPAAKADNNKANEKQGIIRKICGVLDFAVKATKEVVTGTRWSLQEYIENLKSADRSQHIAEWDELERSIIANLADDVVVNSKLGDVEMVVIKSFDEAPTFI